MTITIATSSRSRTISSSMIAVERGSSAEHGSSSSSTSGRTASDARDAEPLLLAAGEPQRRVVEVVLDLVAEAGALERVLDARGSSSACRGARAPCSRSP